MPATNIDEGKLNAFIGQMLSDLGGASSIAMVRLGDTLGLYKAIHANGPMTSMELAEAAKVDERYLREWLSHRQHPTICLTILRPQSSQCQPSKPWCSPTRRALST